MSEFIINNKCVLNGEVNISGSKNAALPIMAASILTNDKSVFKNVPNLSDTEVMCKILSHLGADVSIGNEYVIDTSKLNKFSPPLEICNKIRASFLVAGPLLARFGEATVPLPGGCAIGSRPVDLHLKGLRLLGAEYVIKDGYVVLKCKKLKASNIYLDFPSVGATQNIMMAATLAKGTTVIENPASEPEICDLADYLNSCGAQITGAGTDKIVINGVSNLGGCTHSIIPDRIEAGTFMIGAALTGGKVKLKNVNCSHLKAISSKLSEAGVKITEFSNELSIVGSFQKKHTDIKTLPFPGFPTDMQAQFAALMCVADGTSVITETVFENRFMYIPELVRMNANIKLDGRCAIINGGTPLVGAKVRATDLRAGAALALAGLCADGKTVISDSHYIKRGYSDFAKKLRLLGADVTEID
ncbi:MAG: UDP-N-acetylglucosamine 1-carboxyvinyltransferase [Clostridia bacterium]|nr:UDP-N-acetylglucosamine 1-carboxyvinyltransferase [Clostridia bacterium]